MPFLKVNSSIYGETIGFIIVVYHCQADVMAHIIPHYLQLVLVEKTDGVRWQ